jgi:hypothetical protein
VLSLVKLIFQIIKMGMITALTDLGLNGISGVYNIIRCRNDLTEFWITRFIDHLWIVTISNYESLTEIYTPNATVYIAQIKSHQSSLVISW